MLKSIDVAGFKSINKLTVDLKPLNLFTGTNSSGKSSLIQALLLLAQNLDSKCGLNGPLAAVGDFRDAMNYNVSEKAIHIAVTDGKEQVSITFTENEPAKLAGSLEQRLAYRLSYANNYLQYLSCNRIGSRDIYKKNRTINTGVGINGEYAIDFLSTNKDKALDEAIVKDKNSSTLLYQVNYWLEYIIGANIKVEDILGTDVIKASYGMNKAKFSRPVNVGSGISYLISIIVMCLGSKAEDILVIENPEIHLHPRSQSKLCEFLYFIAASGRQLLVETHSDHIFNAVRAGIATKTMEKECVGINFMLLGSDNCTRNYDIEIGKLGKIENPIPDLFDQFEADLDRMLGL